MNSNSPNDEMTTRISSQQRSRKATTESNTNGIHSFVGGSGGHHDDVIDTDVANIMMTRKETSTVKHTLWKLICINMVVCGIEFCASAGFTYIPPMLLKAGFTETTMTSIMGIGPFLALIMVPFLGRWSDKCHSRFGRRQPFIIGISIFTITSLILIPYGQNIGQYLAPGMHINIALLVIGVIFLDFSCHAGFNPCEALLADRMKNSDDRERGFTVYSTMVSLGGCIGYLITAVDWSSSTLANALGGQEQTAFSFILLLFTISLITTIIMSQDQPASRRAMLQEKDFYDTTIDVKYSPTLFTDKQLESMFEDNGYETGSNDSQEELLGIVTHKPPIYKDTSIVKPLLSSCHQSRSPAFFKKFHIVALLQRSLRMKVTTVKQLPGRMISVVVCFIRRMFDVPLVLRRLFVADFCSWTALMCHNMFYTDYVGQVVYGGNPNADEQSMERRLYDAGIRIGSWGLLLHSITSIFYANLLQNTVIKMYGIRNTYFVGLAIFTLCMVGTLMSNNLAVINVFVALSGTGFAAITTIPNMLITAYHTEKEVYFSDCHIKSNYHKTEELPTDHLARSLPLKSDNQEETRGLAADIAILDSAYFLSQTILSLFVGSIVDFTHSVSTFIIIPIIFGMMACYFSTKVIFTANCMLKVRKQ